MEPQQDLMQEGPGELGAKECGPFPSTFKSKRKSRFLLAKNGEKSVERPHAINGARGERVGRGYLLIFGVYTLNFRLMELSKAIVIS